MRSLTRRMVSAWLGLLLAAVVALAAATAFGGPSRPPPLDSISTPFRSLDLPGRPPSSHYTARDGTVLAYRAYSPAGAPHGSVVLVHGSSSRSDSLHLLADGLARAGYAAYALDIRGHGESGPHGRIAYVGQLEDDIEDFVARLTPAAPRTLMGFSSGGGFTLRFAADRRQRLFDRYMLLSPYLGTDSPTQREDSGGWVGVGLPRIIALVLLNRVGITAFNDLPVLSFALDAPTREVLTADYSYALWADFGPHRDWRSDIRAARQPMQLLAGSADELFVADRYAAAFESAGRPLTVTLVPGVGHMGMTLQRAAIDAIVAALDSPPAPTQ